MQAEPAVSALNAQQLKTATVSNLVYVINHLVYP